MLLQSFGRELLVLDYALNKARITALYCVNKARPQLHCDGKCYLAQKLRKAAQHEQKAPGAGLVKLKLDVVLPPSWQLPAMPARYHNTRQYARLAVPAPPLPLLRGTFRPPAFQG